MVSSNFEFLFEYFVFKKLDTVFLNKNKKNIYFITANSETLILCNNLIKSTCIDDYEYYISNRISNNYLIIECWLTEKEYYTIFNNINNYYDYFSSYPTTLNGLINYKKKPFLINLIKDLRLNNLILNEYNYAN